MKPVLILKETSKIKSENETLQKSLIDGQAIYDMFKEIGIELTLSDINKLLHQRWASTPSDWINTFIVDKIIEKIGMPNFNGVPIKKEKVREMIETPETKSIYDNVVNISTAYGSHHGGHWFSEKYLTIGGGIISIQSDAEAEIDEKHTHYTRTERGHELASKIQEHVNRFAEYTDYLGKNSEGNPLHTLGDFQMPGLKKSVTNVDDRGKETGYTAVIDLDYIRKQEALFPDYKA